MPKTSSSSRAAHSLPRKSLLFLARKVQEELEDDRPLSGEVVLEMRDVGEALVPDALANERRGKLLPLQNFVMHAHDENLFVVRPVEDADPSPFGKAPGVAPHEVVVEASDLRAA